MLTLLSCCNLFVQRARSEGPNQPPYPLNESGDMTLVIPTSRSQDKPKKKTKKDAKKDAAAPPVAAQGSGPSGAGKKKRGVDEVVGVNEDEDGKRKKKKARQEEASEEEEFEEEEFEEEDVEMAEAVSDTFCLVSKNPDCLVGMTNLMCSSYRSMPTTRRWRSPTRLRRRCCRLIKSPLIHRPGRRQCSCDRRCLCLDRILEVPS